MWVWVDGWMICLVFFFAQKYLSFSHTLSFSLYAFFNHIYEQKLVVWMIFKLSLYFTILFKNTIKSCHNHQNHHCHTFSSSAKEKNEREKERENNSQKEKYVLLYIGFYPKFLSRYTLISHIEREIEIEIRRENARAR